MVSDDVTDRLGVFKTLAEVPEEYRLCRHDRLFAGRDAYAAWETENIDAEWALKESGRVERRWKSHMEARGRHHALATPADVEAFLADLADDVQIERVYTPYWLFLKRFYHWMAWHTDYPHRYNPVLMACVEHSTSEQVWNYVMNDVKTDFK